MSSEKQYIELYEQCREMILRHSSEVMNAQRDAAFERFKKNGFPSRKVERYKYTDMQALFEPDYGLNLNRLEIPVNPYDAFRCDVPNLSTSLYFARIWEAFMVLKRFSGSAVQKIRPIISHLP